MANETSKPHVHLRDGFRRPVLRARAQDPWMVRTVTDSHRARSAFWQMVIVQNTKKQENLTLFVIEY